MPATMRPPTVPAAATTQPANLGEILLREGLINNEQYKQGLREYEMSERPLSRIFVEMGAITEGVKLGVLQKRLSCQLVNLGEVTPRPEAAILLPRPMCEKHHFVPLRVEKGSVVVAMEDPTDVRAISAIETAASMPVQALLAKSEEILDAIRRMPDIGGEEAPKGHGAVYVILSRITLPILCALPIVIFYFLLFTHAPFQRYYENLRLDTFTSVLMFVLASSAWSIIMYWVDGVLFRRDAEQRA
jgi:hypothetical protein